MAAVLFAFILACVGSLGRSVLAQAAQGCVEAGSITEQVHFAGQQTPPFRLNCPLKSDDSQTLKWFKDCQPLDGHRGKSFLEFSILRPEDGGNYTCVLRGNISATAGLTIKEPLCSRLPEFKPQGDLTEVFGKVGSTINLNCTAHLPWDPSEKPCDTTLRWSKDGLPLSNHSSLLLNTSSWSPAERRLVVSSVLMISLSDRKDFGVYTCSVRSISNDFSLQSASSPSHTAAVTAAFIILLLLAVAVVVYSRCHLNLKLWYRNTYGDYELNDGRLYDAYISYVSNEYDRKFVNFILKPHLENKNSYKVHLNENDILPGQEPTAELLTNISRSRRLIVLLSHAYMEQDWCSNHFREGLQHLLELSRKPILIILEGQNKRMRPEVKQQLTEHQHRLTILTWKHNSMTPSSPFWKELALAMPRKVVFHSQSAGDPQTTLQDDKDPMLTLNPDYLDCRADTDPAGDLGIRHPVYKAMSCRAPVLPVDSNTSHRPKPSDIDVSDLGSRNYGARSDFYCLVTEEDVWTPGMKI